MSITPKGIPTGAIRYNTDSNKMECFDGTKWWQIATEVSSPIGGRGFMVGDADPAAANVIETYTMETLGNAVDWGDLTTTVGANAAIADPVRGVRLTGCSSYPATYTNVIDYFSLSSQGNATDFGDVIASRRGVGSFGDRTRGGSFGGRANAPGSYADTNTIDYVTIQSTGNSQDFGDLSSITGLNGSSEWGSATRAMIGRMSANVHPTSTLNRIDYLTVQTKGNTIDFGDLNYAPDGPLTASNSTRGILAGGYQPGALKTMDYVEIATTGNATDFGDLLAAVGESSAVGGRTRAFFVHNYLVAQLDYATIATKGNNTRWGDIVSAKNHDCQCSNSHGGL